MKGFILQAHYEKFNDLRSVSVLEHKATFCAFGAHEWNKQALALIHNVMITTRANEQAQGPKLLFVSIFKMLLPIFYQKIDEEKLLIP